MPYHWLDFTPPQPQIAAAPVEDFVTAASIRNFPLGSRQCFVRGISALDSDTCVSS